MVFGIYSRKSKWTGKGESIENQVQLCKEYIESKYPNSPEKRFAIYEDEGFSGKNTTRPEFQRLLADIRSRKLDGVVCYRLDRISRSVGDFARTIEEFEQYNIDFICIKEQFDTSTPMGKAMMNIAAVFAQLERETIAERIRDNMLLLAKTGRWLGGVTPLGFASGQVEKVLEDGKMRVSHRLCVVREEIKLVELMFSKFLDGESVTAVESHLLKEGIFTRNGKRFVAATLKEVLSNPVYCVADQKSFDYFAAKGCVMGCDPSDFNGSCGVSAYNRTSSEGRYQSRRPMGEWIIAAGRHKGVIPSGDWIRAQSILYRNRIYRFQYNPRNRTSLLSGLLYCKRCGATMRPRVNSNSLPDEQGSKTFYYMCDLKRKSNKEKCASENLPGNRLDQQVCALLIECNRDAQSKIHGRLRELSAEILSGGTTLHKEIAVAEERLRNCGMEVRKRISLLGREPEDSVLYQQARIQVEELTDEMQRLRERLDALEEESREAVELDGEMRRALGALETLEGTFADASPADKRELLHALIERMEWDGRNIEVFLLNKR